MKDEKKRFVFIDKDVGEDVVPPQYRMYIKDPRRLESLPEGLRVYRGKHGGMFIDLRELKRLKGLKHEEGKKEGKKRQPAVEQHKPKNIREYISQTEEGNREFRRIMMEEFKFKNMVEVEEEEEGEKDKKYKGIFKNGKIRLNPAAMSPEEIVSFSETFSRVKAGDIESAAKTLGWYYYHMVMHMLLRTHDVPSSILSKVSDYSGHYQPTNYSRIDDEEWICEIFSLFVFMGGDMSKYDEASGKYMRELLKEIYGSKVTSSRGFVKDSFSYEVGVDKSGGILNKS